MRTADVVCLSHVPWSVAIERPHQVMRRLARGRRVFFVEDPVVSRGKPRAQIRALAHGDIHVVSVRVPPELYEAVLEMMQAVAPALQAAYDKHLAALAFLAWKAWPVASGLSKSLLALEYEVSEGGDTFTGRIRSRAPYTVFIAGQPHRVLIENKAAAVADKIGTDALDELARL